MSKPLPYAEIGLTSGIEIHQQLDTPKLFMPTPSLIRDDEPDRVVKRRLRASAGELGKVDAAAQAEMKKEKYFLYEYYDDTNCLIELDEEPPHPMNKDAFTITLQICKLLNAQVVDQVHVMRKTVVDGSNTSGFQRTAFVGYDGAIDVDGCKVRIDSICLEEDAAKIVEQTAEYSRFNLSKMGIPLAEIATGPDMHTPSDVQAVAAYLGMVLRSTGRVKRGLGTIRQDVNVSVREGARVEIKGAQDLKMIPEWVENEARRQLALIDIKKKLPAEIVIDATFVDITHLLSSCESKIIQGALSKKGILLAVKLPGFAGLVGMETSPNRRLGSEFSDYAKVAAGVGGIFHSDELPKYGITQEHVDAIAKELKCADSDAFVFVAAQEKTAQKALDAVCTRAMLCSQGVLMEVRKPQPNGSTSYMRPMPGAARMYPETDCSFVEPDLQSLVVPKLLTEQKADFKKEFNLNDDFVNALFRASRETLFKELLTECTNLKPTFIAETLVGVESELSRKHNVTTEGLTDAHFREVLVAVHSGELPKQSVVDAFVAIVKKGSFDVNAFKGMDESELTQEIQAIIAENEGLAFNALIGRVMAKLRGKADGKKIVELTKKYS